MRALVWNWVPLAIYFAMMSWQFIRQNLSRGGALTGNNSWHDDCFLFAIKWVFPCLLVWYLLWILRIIAKLSAGRYSRFFRGDPDSLV